MDDTMDYVPGSPETIDGIKTTMTLELTPTEPRMFYREKFFSSAPN